jgi:hypothetical protein
MEQHPKDIESHKTRTSNCASQPESHFNVQKNNLHNMVQGRESVRFFFFSIFEAIDFQVKAQEIIWHTKGYYYTL